MPDPNRGFDFFILHIPFDIRWPVVISYTAIALSAGTFTMKKILTITVVLSVFAAATVGCLYIFDILSFEDSVSNLLKLVAVIVLLGGCSALIAFLMRSNKEPPT